MGKKIDCLVAVLLSTLAAYAYYMAMTERIWLSLLLSGITMLALKRIVRAVSGVIKRARKPSARAKARSAKQRVDGWLEADEADAAGDIVHLIAQAYPEQFSVVNGRLIYRSTGALVPFVLLARRTPLGADDILRAWKAQRGAEHLIIASTAPLGTGASAANLASPKVAVVDRPMLEKLAAKHLDVIAPTRAPVSRRPRGWLARMIDRKKAPRYLLYGTLMLAFYLFLGTHAYLAAALVMLLLAGLGFHSAAMPEKLL